MHNIKCWMRPSNDHGQGTSSQASGPDIECAIGCIVRREDVRERGPVEQELAGGQVDLLDHAVDDFPDAVLTNVAEVAPVELEANYQSRVAWRDPACN